VSRSSAWIFVSRPFRGAFCGRYLIVTWRPPSCIGGFDCMQVVCGSTCRCGSDNSTVHRLFQDDLASVSISPMRASGVVTSDTTLVDIVFGEGDDGLRREVKVVHRRFPNGGEWSFFVCPVCDRPARVLKLHEKPMCRRCCLREGVGYRVSSGSLVERDVARVARLQKLRKLLDGGPVRLHPRPGRRLDRRWSLSVSYRRGMIRERQDLLRLRHEGLRLQ
jgi:hypothetical protein